MKNSIKISVSLSIAAALIAAGCFSSSNIQPAATTRPAQMSSAPPVFMTVNVDQPGAPIAPAFYGFMTEEINHSYDGGLYAELIQNRSFQNSQYDAGRGAGAPGPDANYLIHWSVVNSDGASGTMSMDANEPVNTTALTHSLKLEIASVGDGQRVGVANDGYWGIPVKPNTEYKASFYAKASAGMSSPLTVAIESSDGRTTYASGTIPPIGTAWHQYSLTLKTAQVQQTADARFVVSASKSGSLWLSLVSLFPPTYNNRPNGNRQDIMQLLVDMKPGFLRYPGGNYLEGRGLAERWAWKNTIGPLEDRLGHGNHAWNYRSSDGMGMMEFLEWCEDMHAEPVMALYAGFSLGATYSAQGDDIKPFVQEGLDAIEFATGDAATQWGARRAQLGHPKPFKLTYVEIGNEEAAGASYVQRFEAFYDAIKAKYPNLKIISSFRQLPPNSTLTRKPDVIDDHQYMSISQALQFAHRYDTMDRNGPKVFVGEWATRVPTTGDTCNLAAGVADAAYLTGMERNADLVIMNCYAPLFVNVNPGGRQWPVNLIGYNALTSFGSPSYYVQKMFSNNLGSVVLPVKLEAVPVAKILVPPANGGRRGAPAPPPTQPTYTDRDGIYASASRDNANGDIILKLVNVQDSPQPIQVDLQGVNTVGGKASVEVLTGNPNDINTVGEPTKVAPRKMTITYAAAKFMHELPAQSVSIVRLKTK